MQSLLHTCRGAGWLFKTRRFWLQFFYDGVQVAHQAVVVCFQICLTLLLSGQHQVMVKLQPFVWIWYQTVVTCPQGRLIVCI